MPVQSFNLRMYVNFSIKSYVALIKPWVHGFGSLVILRRGSGSVKCSTFFRICDFHLSLLTKPFYLERLEVTLKIAWLGMPYPKPCNLRIYQKSFNLTSDGMFFFTLISFYL